MKRLQFNLSELRFEEKARAITKDVVAVCIPNGAGHIAPALSCVDILVALYYRLMSLSKDPAWSERDRLVFSKAHGCYSLYSILADIGYIDRKKDWETFYRGSFLSGCVERSVAHGIDAGCGSLGHGLPLATGLAFGAKLQRIAWRTYCVVGDGEMQEGSCWEALQYAVKHELRNLTVIIDANNLQAMDFVDNVLTKNGRKDDLIQKCRGFGCVAEECDGHTTMEIVRIIEAWNNDPALKAPQVLVARTIKGKGLKCMENKAKYHFRLPTEEELSMGTRYE